MFILQKTNRIITKRRYAYAAVLVCVVGLVAIGFVRSSAKRSTISIAPTMIPSFSSSKLVQGKVKSIDSERVTLRATGFEPENFTRAAGRFLLSVDNRAEMGEMRFRLLRQDGTGERDFKMKNDKFRLRQVIQLTPGRYALGVVDHPEWVCRITITAP